MPATRTPYPPEVYAAAPPEELVRAPQTPLWVWFALTAAAGIPAGPLWWAAAPGGAFYGDGSDPAAWLPRDLTLGLVGILIGLVIGILVARQRFAAAAAARTTTAVAGSALGSVIAWLGGEWTASLFGGPVQATASVMDGFALASFGILALWPATVALTMFIVTMSSMLRTAPHEEPRHKHRHVE